MTDYQFDFGNKDPSATSGTQLMDAILEPWRNALHSNHMGPARPSYVVEGMFWINNNATPWILNYFDGSSDLPIAAVNPSTHILSLYHNGSLLGSAASKDTGTSSGQVPTNADLGDLAILDIGHGLESSSGALRVKLDGASLARSSSGIKVADNAIDLDQLAHKTANTLLGMNSSGVPSVISAGTGITILAGVISFSGSMPVVTDWVEWTPTFSGFTVSGVKMFSRRVAGDLEYFGKFTVTAAAASEARMSLGYNGTDGNVTSDSTNVPSLMLSGSAVFSASGFGPMPVVLMESAKGYVTFGGQGTTYGGLNKRNADFYVGSGTWSVRGSMPVDGWS